MAVVVVMTNFSSPLSEWNLRLLELKCNVTGLRKRSTIETEKDE